MCVWNIWKDVKLHVAWWWMIFVILVFESFLQGAPEAWIGQVPTKTPIQCLWYHGWSPWRTCQFFLKWEEAQPKNLHVVHLNFSLFCTVVAIWHYFILFWTSLHQNLPQKVYFALKFTLDQLIFFLAVCKGLFCARVMHSTTKFAMLFLSKCVSFLLYTSSWQEPFGESLSRLTIDSKTMSEFTLLN